MGTQEIDLVVGPEYIHVHGRAAQGRGGGLFQVLLHARPNARAVPVLHPLLSAREFTEPAATGKPCARRSSTTPSTASSPCPIAVVQRLIDHPWFQRLRHIKQLSLTHLVYPGALHTRFHHALGAMHLMGEAITVLRGKGHHISHEEALGALHRHPAARHRPWSVQPYVGAQSGGGHQP